MPLLLEGRHCYGILCLVTHMPCQMPVCSMRPSFPSSLSPEVVHSLHALDVWELTCQGNRPSLAPSSLESFPICNGSHHQGWHMWDSSSGGGGWHQGLNDLQLFCSTPVGAMCNCRDMALLSLKLPAASLSAGPAS